MFGSVLFWKLGRILSIYFLVSVKETTDWMLRWLTQIVDWSKESGLGRIWLCKLSALCLKCGVQKLGLDSRPSLNINIQMYATQNAESHFIEIIFG